MAQASVVQAQQVAQALHPLTVLRLPPPLQARVAQASGARMAEAQAASVALVAEARAASVALAAAEARAVSAVLAVVAEASGARSSPARRTSRRRSL